MTKPKKLPRPAPITKVVNTVVMHGPVGVFTISLPMIKLPDEFEGAVRVTIEHLGVLAWY